MRTARVSSGGQISIPAEVRRRWRTDLVTVDDLGNQLVIRPVPVDPIRAARGSLKGGNDLTTDQMRAQTREEDRRIEERRYGHS